MFTSLGYESLKPIEKKSVIAPLNLSAPSFRRFEGLCFVPVTDWSPFLANYPLFFLSKAIVNGPMLQNEAQQFLFLTK